MIQRRGSASVLTGSSVHNTPIERLWRDVRKSVVEPLRVELEALEENGVLDPDNKVDIYCLHRVLKKRINSRLSEFTSSWNNHLLRTESNYTPLQLFCMYSGSDTSDKDSGSDGLAQQTPSICSHIEVPGNRFNPCSSLSSEIRSLMLRKSNLSDSELYRLVATTVGDHLTNAFSECCMLT